MTRYRVVLILDALALLYFGLAFLISPRGMTATFGISLAGTDAVADVCAVYGGYELGIGAFLAYCALSLDRLKPGLICGALALSGFLLGRVIGIASEGHPTGATYQLLSLDFVGAVLNVGALVMYLRATRRTGAPLTA